MSNATGVIDYRKCHLDSGDPNTLDREDNGSKSLLTRQVEHTMRRERIFPPIQGGVQFAHDSSFPLIAN